MVFAVNVFVPILLIIILSKTNLALKYTNSKHMCICRAEAHPCSFHVTKHLTSDASMGYQWLGIKIFQKYYSWKISLLMQDSIFFLSRPCMAYFLAPAQEMPDDFVVIYMQLGSIVLPYFSIYINYTALEVNYPIYYCCMFKILFSCIAFQPRFSRPLPPNSHLPQCHPTLVTLRKKADLPGATNKRGTVSYIRPDTCHHTQAG